MKTLEECIDGLQRLGAAAALVGADESEDELFAEIKEYLESTLFYLQQFKEEAEI